MKFAWEVFNLHLVALKFGHYEGNLLLDISTGDVKAYIGVQFHGLKVSIAFWIANIMLFTILICELPYKSTHSQGATTANARSNGSLTTSFSITSI